MKPRLRLSSTKPKPILSVIPNGLQRHSFAHSRVNGAADTVNPDEIAHFSRLSEHWWDENGEFSMLHKMNPIRVEFIRDRVRRVREDEGSSSTGLTGLDVLDVGCGGGLLSESITRLGAKTLAIDASDANIRIATAHAQKDPMLRQRLNIHSSSSNPSGSLQYRHTTTSSLIEEGKTFDVVCALEVVEHVSEPSQFLKECSELVRPGGHLFLSTIARTPLSYFLTIFMAERVLGMITPGTHHWNQYIQPSELIKFFQSSVPWLPSGSKDPPSDKAEVRGMVFNPINRKWAIAPRGAPLSLECNYIVWIRKPNVAR